MVEKDSFDGMLLDPRLPDVDGIEVLRQTKNGFPNIKVVILSGHATAKDFETLYTAGSNSLLFVSLQISRK